MLPSFQTLKKTPFFKRARSLSVALLMTCAGSTVLAQEMIPSNGILTSQKGSITVKDDSGEKLSLELRVSILPTGTSWTTSKKSTAFLSLSNGVAIGIDASTQVRIVDYQQKPYEAKNQGFEYEPSASKLQLQFDSGQIAIASNRPSPLSELRIQLPIGSLRIHKGTSIIRYDDMGLQLLAVDGNLTYYYPDGETRVFVTQGHRVRISEASAKRQQLTERQEKAEIDTDTKKFAAATQHSSRRILYKANKATGQPPEPVIVVRPDYFKQPSIRPYQFQD